MAAELTKLRKIVEGLQEQNVVLQDTIDLYKQLMLAHKEQLDLLKFAVENRAKANEIEEKRLVLQKEQNDILRSEIDRLNAEITKLRTTSFKSKLTTGLVAAAAIFLISR